MCLWLMLVVLYSLMSLWFLLIECCVLNDRCVLILVDMWFGISFRILVLNVISRWLMMKLVFLLWWLWMVFLRIGLYVFFWMVFRISDGFVVVFCGLYCVSCWKLFVLVMMVVYCFSWLSVVVMVIWKKCVGCWVFMGCVSVVVKWSGVGCCFWFIILGLICVEYVLVCWVCVVVVGELCYVGCCVFRIICVMMFVMSF